MDIIFLCQGSHRTDFDTLSAVDTCSGRQGDVFFGIHIAFSCLLVAFHLIDANLLNFIAHSHTASAGNTFIQISHHSRTGIIDSPSRHLTYFRIDSKTVCHILKLTVPTGFLTGQTIVGVLFQNFIQTVFPVFLNCRCIGTDHHAIFGTYTAGSADHCPAFFFNLHCTDSTSSCGSQTF